MMLSTPVRVDSQEELDMVKKLAGFICLFVVLLAVACAQTDVGITTSVKSELAADDVVKAHEINVDTKEGVVSLTGAVPTAEVKERAVELARATDGVTSVVDNLTVTTAAADRDLGDETAATTGRVGDTANDATITASIKTKLLADDDVSGLKIDVDTTGGVVTLTGNVKTAAEKAEAIRIARETDGVKSVEDRLKIGE
jgi:hyperosmotically inducible periplasmic protein